MRYIARSTSAMVSAGFDDLTRATLATERDLAMLGGEVVRKLTELLKSVTSLIIVVTKLIRAIVSFIDFFA